MIFLKLTQIPDGESYIQGKHGVSVSVSVSLFHHLASVRQSGRHGQNFKDHLP